VQGVGGSNPSGSTIKSLNIGKFIHSDELLYFFIN